MSREERLKNLAVAARMAGIKVSIKALDVTLALDECLLDKGGETTLDDIQRIIDVVNKNHDIQGS